MTIININGQEFKPSEMSIGIQSVSASDAGRDQGGTMHVNLITRKIKIELSWWCPSREETARILTAVNDEYFPATFYNPQTNSLETRTFYVGDRSAPVQQWADQRQFYSRVSFNIIER